MNSNQIKGRDVLRNIPLNTSSSSSFPIWNDTKETENLKSIFTPASTATISMGSNPFKGKQRHKGNIEYSLMFLIIKMQQKQIQNLQKKIAFMMFKYAKFAFESSQSSQNYHTTPKKRRYQKEEDSHDHLGDLSQNIFSSPTRPGSAYSSPIRGKSRDLPDKKNATPFTGIYSTPDKVRPPKHPITQPLPPPPPHSAHSSPLRPTLFQQPHGSTPLVPPHPQNSDEGISSLTQRLESLEKLLLQLTTSSTSTPAPAQTENTLPGHFSTTTQTPHIPPQESTNLSSATLIPPPSTEEEEDNFHSKINFASIDAMRTLHLTHREYHHPHSVTKIKSPTSLPPSLVSPSPSSIANPVSNDLKRYYPSKSSLSLDSPPSPILRTTETHVVDSFVNRPLQVPLTHLSSLQTKMTSWKERYHRNLPHSPSSRPPLPTHPSIRETDDRARKDEESDSLSSL